MIIMMMIGWVACSSRNLERDTKTSLLPYRKSRLVLLFRLPPLTSLLLPPSLSFFPNLIVARAVQGYIKGPSLQDTIRYIYIIQGSSKRYGIVSYRIVSDVSFYGFTTSFFSLISPSSLSYVSPRSAIQNSYKRMCMDMYYPIPKNRENSFLLSYFGLF